MLMNSACPEYYNSVPDSTFGAIFDFRFGGEKMANNSFNIDFRAKPEELSQVVPF